MTIPRDPDEILAAWLDEGPTRLPDQTRRAIAVALPTTSQRRRANREPWRSTTMSTMLKLASGAVAVIAVVLGGAFLLGGALILGPSGSTGVGGQPTSSPSPTAGPTPTPVPSPVVSDTGLIDTRSWATYDSRQYGYSIGHPADWTVMPATRAWMPADAMNALSTAHEDFRSPDGHVRVSVWSIPLEPGVTMESVSDIQSWVEDYCRTTDSSTCTGIPDRAVPLCNEKRDCHPGLLVPFTDDVQAFFTGGSYPSERMIVVAVWWGENAVAVAPYGGSQRLLEAFLSTMNVWTAPAATP